MSVALDFRSVNSLWGSVVVETLVRMGVTHAIVSPGSRSTPLTLALVRHARIEAIPVLDERSAAFFALGLAKQHRRPVVLLCTSGTAGAHYFPAVIEAQESGVPLLIITADRPPEMRDCASGQTIDQQKLFGSHVNFYHELAVPGVTLPLLAYVRQTIVAAVERTLSPSAGPVHLNAPFRDPLVPATGDAVSGIEIDDTFFDHLGTAIPTITQATLWQRPTTARGLIVAGPNTSGDAATNAKKIIELSAALGWPVLADALSVLRGHAAGAASVITAYDAILRDAALARDLTPRTVLCLGGWPTSKVLRGWLEAVGAEILVVAPSAANRDALHGRTRQIMAPIDSLAVAGERIADPSYFQQWQRAENAARKSLDAAMADEAGMFEGKACWLLARSLPVATPVFVASSMPIRDVEYFWPRNDRAAKLWFNRGANGIDGTLSTALGIAHGGAPSVVLTGDLALLHDANGFLLRPKFRGSLTIVLINNRGGGIFEHLPIAKCDPPFEDFFATPQEVDFEKLCGAHGVSHILVRDWAHFSELIAILPESGVRVLEVCTDRKRDAAIRKAWLAAAGKAAGGA